MAKARYNSRQLTQHLRELAAQAHDWSEEDGAITKGEALARLLWKKALGYKEVKVDDEGNEKEEWRPPESWAIQLVYDRMEGKTPQAVTEDETRITAAEQVSELAKNRLTALADKLVAGSAPPPPVIPDEEDTDDQ